MKKHNKKNENFNYKKLFVPHLITGLLLSIEMLVVATKVSLIFALLILATLAAINIFSCEIATQKTVEFINRKINVFGILKLIENAKEKYKELE